MFISDQAALHAISSDTQRDQALSWVYQECGSSIRQLGREYGFAQEDCDDVLQEAVVVFWTQVTAGTFILTAKISNYIYGICNNLFLRKSRDRKKARFVDVPDLEDIMDDDGTDELTLFREHLLEGFLSEIGERCQSILVDFYTYGRSLRELALKYNYSNEVTVTSQKYRCVMQLRRKFQAS